ncbi:TrmB family transcriptional regulator [Candidatus Nanohalobium constans]|uniref:TrmB family transcriptional regulator n=1 Tax=Candidatus Nanohalobium constans TaxID=2565781 RepID=A0A5Q0UGK9_9ARCH|nr:helix-turn-helix domain-containing protein [Candidatus Nanohalobium constans]QGA80734.1 TrmB family transcriptional regulator [Candidatus Nanohalobium constans]
MVASKETLDKLEDIGLNMYERKIYSALLGRSVSTAGELSEMTNVPRSRAYDVLESLAEKGLVVIKSSSPMEYVSIPPEQAIENIKQQHKQELEDKLDDLENFKDSEAVDELESLYDQGVELVDPAEMSGSLKGEHQINQHMGTMMKDAEESIKVMTSEKGLNDLMENHSDLLQEAKDQGINVQVLAPVTDQNQSSYEKMKDFAEVRHLGGMEEKLEGLDAPEGEFTIIDNDALTMSMTHDDVHSTQDTAFWSQSDHMAESVLDPMFNVLWHHSSNPEEGPEKPGKTPGDSPAE